MTPWTPSCGHPIPSTSSAPTSRASCGATASTTIDELVRRSVADVAWFWDAVVRDLDLAFLEPYERVLDTREGIEWATWFVGGRVNLAHQCVDRWAARTPDATAVIWEGEDGEVHRWTYAELRSHTDRLARALRSLGVQEGDPVGIFLPMALETVSAVMACSKIGAVWVPIFSGFGPDAVASRLADAGAKVLLTAGRDLAEGSRRAHEGDRRSSRRRGGRDPSDGGVAADRPARRALGPSAITTGTNWSTRSRASL